MWLPALWLFGLVAVLYANSLPNGFVFDDHVLVDFNPIVNPATTSAVEQRHISYRPLRVLSYVLDREIGGHHPASYRIGNMVYHALAGCVAYVTYQQLGLSPFVALLGATFFVAHPVQTESVAYISGRRDVLCALLTLLAFSLFLRWRGSRRRWWYLVLAAVSLVAAALTKEVAFAFPLIIVAYDLSVSLMRQRWAAPSRSTIGALWRLLREQWVAYAVLAVLGAAGTGYLAARGFKTTHGWWGGGPVTNFLNVALLWVHSGVLLLFPVRLLADYSYEAVPLVTTAAAPLAWGAVAALLALFLVSLWMLPRMPRAVFLLWWIPVTLLPSSHVIPHHDFFAEHYLYLPLFGFAGLQALALMRVGRQLGLSRQRVEIVGLILVLLYGVRVVIRNRDWHDDLTLWRVTSRTAPHCARARGNYGGALLSRGEVDAAEPELRASLAIQPNQPGALSGLIMVEHAKGRYAERDALLQRLSQNPNFSYANFLSLAGWFLINGEYSLALQVAQQAARRPEVDARLWTIEGWAYAQKGQFDVGCPLFDRALSRDPRSPDALAGKEFCRRHAAH
jgi:protein O-mannosyl-transferase